MSLLSKTNARLMAGVLSGVLLLGLGANLPPAHAKGFFDKLNPFSGEKSENSTPQSTPAPQAAPAIPPAFIAPEAEAKQTQAGTTASPMPSLAPTSVQLAQPELMNPNVAEPVASSKNPPTKQLLIDNPKNPYGLTYARNQLAKCNKLSGAGLNADAQTCLTPLKEWLIQATEAHINLNKSLSRVRSAQAQAELEKQLALNFALLRDEAFYQQAKLMVARNQQKEAIKLLVGVVESQPRNQLGVKSYELLQGIGFTERLQLVEAPANEPSATEDEVLPSGPDASN
ncbi:MAG: hypothetical protein VKJ06_06015 [Vampirovibrionales bacterium]|nr:hypothetical protein [Vampirovibrionales bacterium]